MTLKALVVDDEAPARAELRFLLDEVGGVEVVGEASNVSEAFQLIKAIPYDVVFLDIDMPGLSGMRLAETLAGVDRQPAIVFVTAHSEHAVKAFEVSATDYLMKPVEMERLRAAIARLSPAPADGARVDRIPVEKSGKKLLLHVEDICYVMARDDYSYLHTDGERYLSTVSLSQLEKRLTTAGFFRVHRRYLVNLSKVREVVPMYGGTLLLTLQDQENSQVPVSRRRVPSLKKALGL
ncbi:MAG: response regulator transcription factor [Clostridiales bacterium]|nr:response regulator transcription factor [Clostridiales bacterium]